MSQQKLFRLFPAGQTPVNAVSVSVACVFHLQQPGAQGNISSQKSSWKSSLWNKGKNQNKIIIFTHLFTDFFLLYMANIRNHLLNVCEVSWTQASYIPSSLCWQGYTLFPNPPFIFLISPPKFWLLPLLLSSSDKCLPNPILVFAEHRLIIFLHFSLPTIMLFKSFHWLFCLSQNLYSLYKALSIIPLTIFTVLSLRHCYIPAMLQATSYHLFQKQLLVWLFLLIFPNSSYFSTCRKCSCSGCWHFTENACSKN